MKTRVLDVVHCPSCGGALTVVAGAREDRGEIRDGTLRCAGCAATYPIHGYIPRLAPELNYSASWGKLWRETGEILRDSFTEIPFHRNALHGSYDEAGTWHDDRSPFGFEWPTDLSGERVLEVGPGTGNFTEHLVETGANLVCVDMSDAIDTLPEELLTRENVDLIQGDITTGILRGAEFDRLWLFQVLQHTPSPAQTLKDLRALLRPGGELAFTSYGYPPYDPWYYRFTKRIPDRIAWTLIAAAVPRLLPLKFSLQRRRKTFATRLSLALLDLVDPRDIYRQTRRGGMRDYVQGALWERTGDHDLLVKYVIVNTFDRITPEYTNSASHAMVEDWTRSAGYASVETWGRGGVRARAIK